jgi:DNA-binding beta-propeller fold protein YncE
MNSRHMLLVAEFLAFTATLWPAELTTLRQVQTIPLPNVEGRIDHFGIDVAGQRLFVAALGNNTVEVLDLRQGKRLTTITGLKEPQGIFYVPNSNRLFVANGDDGNTGRLPADGIPL